MSDVLASQAYADLQSPFFQGDGWIDDVLSANKNKVITKKLIKSKKLKNILLIGGVHGNETEGVRFMEDFCREFADKNVLPYNFFLIPVFNPDGFLVNQRKNGNGVDLNRNMPTKDWTAKVAEEKYYPGKQAASEPENKFLVEIIASFKPDYIISFHSWKPLININGPAQKHGEAMTKHIDMKVVEDIGYPTPGSLGTYAGLERQIPTITFEFERGLNLDEVYPLARDGVLESFKVLDIDVG